ncbi:PREDICTED: fatty acid synthase-like [Vollenhovia emeryi]|uniref:fatty acid synthase-like n=1 Tax=Vollenhovia emeryi TaxID=411798 RepID=UPI0005F52A19|nr:PREDICTED: fatty acid synthase-like [Vollenhovia emeryi]
MTFIATLFYFKIGFKDMKKVPPNVSLAEMGMDSMTAAEIKQTLEREFDISLSAKDMRNLTFAKLAQMTAKREEIQDTNQTDSSNMGGFEMLIKKTKDSDFAPDTLVELATKNEIDRDHIFLIPGIEGCSSVYKSMASGIKSSATCLQHVVLNISDNVQTIIKLATCLVPHVLEKMKNQRKFLIVGYSFGSLIAIELVRLLESRDFSGRLILIDGAPDQLKLMTNFAHTSPAELENIILLFLLQVYTRINKETIASELNKCNTIDEKLKIFHTYFPLDANVLSIDNQKLMYYTIYNHVRAILDYNISSLPRIKSPITLLKPAFPIISFPEEDYGLHKVKDLV